MIGYDGGGSGEVAQMVNFIRFIIKIINDEFEQIYKMLQMEQISNEETPITHNESSQKNSIDVHRPANPIPIYQQPRRQSKMPVILLLLILILYVSFLMIKVRFLANSNSQDLTFENDQNSVFFKKLQNSQKDLQTGVKYENGYGSFKRLQIAKEHYLVEREKMDSLSQGAKLLQVQQMVKARYQLQKMIAAERPDPMAVQLLQNGQSDHKFQLPTTVWTFLTRPLQQQSYVNFLTISNNIRILRDTSYRLNFVKKDNYKNYLSQTTLNQLETAIKLVQNSDRSSQGKEQVKKFLIIVALMQEKGGIFVEEYVSLLEDFQWLQDIANNIFLNRGLRNVEPQVFGFYSMDHSSPLLRQEKPEMVQVKQYMRLFPGLQHYFLAAIPHSAFFTALKKQMRENINKSQQQMIAITRDLHKIKAFKPSINIWQNFFIINSQQVLVAQQQRLTPTNYNKNSGLFAIDSYGLKTINRYYFPYKIDFIFTKYQFQKTYTHLSRHPLQEFQSTVGPLRYIAVITPRNQIDYLLQIARKGNSLRFIITDSFLQKYLFNDSQESFIIVNPERPLKKMEHPKWTKLPKIVWLFWDKGFSSSHATNQLAKRNIEKYAGMSGFKVIEVNQTNLKDYINLAEMEKIQDTLYFNNRGSKYDQTYSDLVRLALLKEHGGIYMDASFMLLQDLQWLVDIASYPSQYVFNRYGQLPSIFMFFNPHYGCPYDEWWVDPNFNTKAHWHLSYENNFIACEPKHELIIEWFDTLLNYLSQPYSQTEKDFKECGIEMHKWSTKDDTYLLPMDAIKCVIGNKEKQLKNIGKSQYLSPASQHYKIWSMSGYNGVQKFRSLTNFQNPGSDDNLFFRKYSQNFVSSLMGKPKQVIKLYSNGNLNLNNFMRDNLQGRIFHEIHHQSFFNKYMLSLRSDDEDFIIINDNLLIRENQRIE